MSLYLDSAYPQEARRAFAAGLVSGITTNPTLIAQTRHPAMEVITQLCDLSTGIVFHQLAEESTASRKKEAERMAGIRPGRVGLKIPCTYENRGMRAVIDAEGASTQIIAASIKNPDEAVSTLLAGAHHLTLPLKLIESMGNHPLSDKAIEDFRSINK
jgi:transaldolase